MLNVTRRTPAYADGLRKLIVRQTKAGCYPPALGPASDQRSMSARGDGGWLIWSILARPSTQHTRASHSPHAQTGPLYGWAISERIQQILEDTLQVNQGSLYPALPHSDHAPPTPGTSQHRASAGARFVRPSTKGPFRYGHRDAGVSRDVASAPAT